MDLEEKLSSRAKIMKASEIREILKLTQSKDMISFAGGLPNPATFPVDKVNEIVSDLLKGDPDKVLQYGTTEGIDPLREELAKMAKANHIDIDYKDILITHGSQQGLDLVGRILIDPTDCVVVGAPTYLGAASVWRQSKAHMYEISVDNDGMDIDEAEEVIKDLKQQELTVKMLYLMTNFHNPKGVTLSESRRKKVIDLAHNMDLIIIEDDPYGRIRFEGEHLRPIKSFDDEGRVIYTSTFSKLLAPGFRIAWITADHDILQKLVLAKQSADLCTNAFGQFVTYEYIRRGYLNEHLPKIIDLYKQKCSIMLKAMDAHFPKEVEFTRPQGGMFSWATCPEGIDSRALLINAIEKNVAFVVGSAFYANPERGRNKMRLNFTHPANEKIEEGIEILGSVIEDHIIKNGKRS